MPNLKNIRTRITSIQSTKKITSAMRMIAASKLRKAQEKAQAARPYAIYMAQMLVDLITRQEKLKTIPKLLIGTGHDQTHLLIVLTANRGLCGSFNSSIVKKTKGLIQKLMSEGKRIKIYCVGQNGYDHLRHDYEPHIIEKRGMLSTPGIHDAMAIIDDITHRFEADEFDQATLIYNRYLSPLKQEVTAHRLIPFTQLDDDVTLFKMPSFKSSLHLEHTSIYLYEPSEEQVLHKLLTTNLVVQVLRAFLENTASEQGARMAAMDGATRNATDMIKKLTLTYNRTRQAYITKELIEVISGAEALK